MQWLYKIEMNYKNKVSEKNVNYFQQRKKS